MFLLLNGTFCIILLIFFLTMKLFIKRRIPYQDHSTKMTSKWRFRALMVWWPLVFRTRQRSCLWALSARARQDKCLYCSRNSWNGSWEPTGFELSLLAESVPFFSSGFSNSKSWRNGGFSPQALFGILQRVFSKWMAYQEG